VILTAISECSADIWGQERSYCFIGVHLSYNSMLTVLIVKINAVVTLKGILEKNLACLFRGGYSLIFLTGYTI
ncbi:hypothetical protein ACVN7G_29330, partial [Escherichia coli]